jgi:hypothetical protein
MQLKSKGIGIIVPAQWSKNQFGNQYYSNTVTMLRKSDPKNNIFVFRLVDQPMKMKAENPEAIF